MSLSDPQPSSLPASADVGVGGLRGRKGNLEHCLLELMSRGSKGTTASGPGGDRDAEPRHLCLLL